MNPKVTPVFIEESPDRSIQVTTKDMINKICDMVLAERRKMADIVYISNERIENILHEKFIMRKLGCRVC